MVEPCCAVIPCIITDLPTQDAANSIEHCYTQMINMYYNDFEPCLPPDSKDREAVLEDLFTLGNTPPEDPEKEKFLELWGLLDELSQRCKVSDILFPNGKLRSTIDNADVQRIQESCDQAFISHFPNYVMQRLPQRGLYELLGLCSQKVVGDNAVGETLVALHSHLLSEFGAGGIPSDLPCVVPGQVFVKDRRIKVFKECRDNLAKMAKEMNLMDLLFPNNQLKLRDNSEFFEEISQIINKEYDGARICDDQFFLVMQLHTSYFNLSKSRYLPDSRAQTSRNRGFVEPLLHLQSDAEGTDQWTEFMFHFDFDTKNIHICFFLSHGQVGKSAANHQQHKTYFEWQAYNDGQFHLSQRVTLDDLEELRKKGKIMYLAKPGKSDSSTLRISAEAASVQSLWEKWWVTVQKKEKKDLHLVIVADMCQSGQLVDDLAAWANESVKRAMSDARCSITVQASCRTNEVARGAYFAPTWLQLNRAMFPKNESLKPRLLEEFEYPLDINLQHPCYHTVGKVCDGVAEKLVLCNEDHAAVVYAVWMTYICKNPKDYENLDQIVVRMPRTLDDDIKKSHTGLFRDGKYEVKEVKFFLSQEPGKFQMATLIEATGKQSNTVRPWSQHVHFDTKTLCNWNGEAPQWKLEYKCGQSSKELTAEADLKKSVLVGDPEKNAEKTAVVVMALVDFEDIPLELENKTGIEWNKWNKKTERQGKDCSCKNQKKCRHGYFWYICDNNDAAQEIADTLNRQDNVFHAFTAKDIFTDSNQQATIVFDDKMVKCLLEKVIKLIKESQSKHVVLRLGKNGIKRELVSQWWQDLQKCSPENIESQWETLTSIPNGICRARYFRGLASEEEDEDDDSSILSLSSEDETSSLS